MCRASTTLAAMVFVVACSSESGTQVEPEPRSGPPCPTNIEEVASQVFEVSCVTLGCHNSSDRAAGLDLQASPRELFGQQAAICDGEVLVVPGDSASSHLIDRLRGTACGPQMPVVEPRPDETIDCIAAWIDGLDPEAACETCGTSSTCFDGECQGAEDN